jgi:aerobic carbon-monoxide dehydrogenase medium subunit
MFSASFEYHRPKTVAEAVKLLRDVKGARVLAGGHSLIPAMKLRLASPAALIDVSRIPELSGIKSTKEGLEIGALTTHAAIAASQVVRNICPVLADAAGHVGDQQVRNRGTIGGSVAHSDPGADYPTLMLLLGAKFVAADGKRREIAAKDFFVDLFTTALKEGELLTTIKVPSTEGAKAVYLKHRHPASSFAVVGVAALASKGSDVRVAIGGATANPVAFQVRDGNAVDEAVANALKDPLSDSYASGEYRVHLATVMTKRALTQVAK